MEVEYDENKNYKLKVILIGNSGVGKTNLIYILQDKEFTENEASTPTCSFFLKEMTVDDLNFNVYVWDTIGQEKLKAQTKIFFKNSKIVILVYDISVKQTFTELENWHKQVKDSLGDNIVLGVLGNKKDLFMQEEVSEEEAQAYAKSIGAEWSLTSAKTERQSFVTYLQKLIQIYIKKANIKTGKDEKKEENVKEASIKLDAKNKEPKAKKKFC
jgi:small GTP-binding protein